MPIIKYRLYLVCRKRLFNPRNPLLRKAPPTHSVLVGPHKSGDFNIAQTRRMQDDLGALRQPTRMRDPWPKYSASSPAPPSNESPPPSSSFPPGHPTALNSTMKAIYNIIDDLCQLNNVDSPLVRHFVFTSSLLLHHEFGQL